VSSTQQDAILAAATLMSKRRKETEKYSTESDTGTLRRTVMNTGNAGSRSDPNKSLPPRSPPLKPGNNQNARSFEKEKQLTTGSVAALRARFEKES
jgi:hypothetical protein